MNKLQVVFVWAVVIYFCDQTCEYLAWYLCAVVVWYALAAVGGLPWFVRVRLGVWKATRDIRRSQKRAKAELAADQRRWERRQRETARSTPRTNEPPPSAPVQPSPEEKLAKLISDIESSQLPPDLKLSLKAKARNAYAEEAANRYRW